MKVAFITFEYPPFVQGGAGTYAKNITKELAKLGHEIHIITPHTPGCSKCEVVENCFVHRVPMINVPLLRAPSFWVNQCKEYRKISFKIGGFDIIHSQLISDIWLNKWSERRLPYVITIHHLACDIIDILKPSWFERIRNLGSEIGLTSFIEKSWLRKADKIIAVSEYTKKTLETYCDIKQDKSIVIYNGWEKKELDFSENEINEIKEKYHVKKKTKIVLFVGRIDDPRKGLCTLIKAFKEVLSKTDATLLIVGKGDQTKVKKIADSLNISDNIVFTGFVDEITLNKCYALCDLYVVPSRLEGFGLTILDAMAAGKPIVATNVGAIPEIIHNGENGLLVELNDIKNLSNCILTYLNNDSMSKHVGNKNRKYINNKYTWEVNAITTENVYKEILSKI